MARQINCYFTTQRVSALETTHTCVGLCLVRESQELSNQKPPLDILHSQNYLVLVQSKGLTHFFFMVLHNNTRKT